MKQPIWIWIYAFTLGCLAFSPAGRSQEPTLAQIAAAHNAKTLCSGVFISYRAAEDIAKDELAGTLTAAFSYDVDKAQRTVTVTVGDTAMRAIYRDNCGCTLVVGLTEEEIRAQPVGPPRKRELREGNTLWPAGAAVAEALPKGVNKRKLKAALAYAFSEPSDETQRGTRGVVVVHGGRIVAESYAPGFSKDTALTSWSMTKTVTSALVGILADQGRLELKKPAPVPEWREPGDERHGITLDQLMRMSSGLAFKEEYGLSLSDVVVMLYAKPSAGAYAASQPLEVAPEERWSYSSGTTNIISRIVRDTVGGTMADYLDFARRELFDKLGMDSAMMEPDASGTFVGSSFMYCTPQDWARFGQFLLQDGVWKGERILPEGWVHYTTTPTPKAPQGVYGAQVWLNAGDADDASKRRMRDVPPDAFWLSGFDGQSVTVIPSRDTVVVRMGYTPAKAAFSLNDFLSAVLKALPD